MLKNKIKLAYFALIVSFINLVLYHFPLFEFTADNLDYNSLDGLFTLISVAILLLILNALIFYMGLFTSHFAGKLLLIVFFNINAIALYFINTYGVIIDKTMMVISLIPMLKNLVVFCLLVYCYILFYLE